MALDAEFVEDFDEALVEALVSTDALGEGYIDDLVVPYTHHDVALALLDGLDGADAGN